MISHKQRVERDPKNLTWVTPWWRTETPSKKWPSRPKVLCYERVHEYTDEAPWCTYILHHQSTVAASSMGSEDQERFSFQYVTNKSLFTGCNVNPEAMKKVAEMEAKTDEASKLVENVVSYSTVVELCGKLEDDVLMMNRVKYNLCNKVESIMDKPDKKSAAWEVIQECLSEQNGAFIRWLQEVRSIKKMPVNREIQKNDWFIGYLQENLRLHGYQTTTEFHHNKYSIFGKSSPDFCFHKIGESWIKLGVVTQPTEEMCGVKVDGAAIEFKIHDDDDGVRRLLQAFANMIRASHDLMFDGLKVGKMIDSVVVYGLLVGYDIKKCTPMKYVIDFVKNLSKMEVGESDDFCRVFSYITLVALA